MPRQFNKPNFICEHPLCSFATYFKNELELHEKSHQQSLCDENSHNVNQSDYKVMIIYNKIMNNILNKCEYLGCYK